MKNRQPRTATPPTSLTPQAQTELASALRAMVHELHDGNPAPSRAPQARAEAGPSGSARVPPARATRTTPAAKSAAGSPSGTRSTRRSTLPRRRRARARRKLGVVAGLALLLLSFVLPRTLHLEDPPSLALIIAELERESAAAAEPDASSRTVDPLDAWPEDERLALRPHLESAAALYDLPVRLLEAVIAVESGFNTHARSPQGAVGLMQLMPKTARSLGIRDAFDPVESIHGGAHYLRILLDRFDGNLTLALAAYNAGPTNVVRAGGIPNNRETIDYVQRISRLLVIPANS